MAARGLTAGEIALAQALFKDVIDYARVTIHDNKFVFFQASNSGMTPNGAIYAVGDRTYSRDYSLESVSMRAFFIHEMAHVWQYQLKVLRPIPAAIGEYCRSLGRYARAYRYELTAGKDLLQYRLEQQAQIVQDYYLLQMGAARDPQKRRSELDASAAMSLYQDVLANFLNDPGYPRRRRWI